MQHSVRNQTAAIFIAWTGGDRYPPLNKINHEELRLVRMLTLESARTWQKLWGEKPDRSTLRGLFRRARYYAHATMRYHSRLAGVR